MKTRQELLALIEEAGGKYESNGIAFEAYADGNTKTAIKAQDIENPAHNATLWNHCDKTSDFSINYMMLGVISECIEFAGRLATVCEVEEKPLQYRPPETPSAQVIRVKDESDALRAQGMVEAYEKILLGRNLNISA